MSNTRVESAITPYKIDSLWDIVGSEYRSDTTYFVTTNYVSMIALWYCGYVGKLWRFNQETSVQSYSYKYLFEKNRSEARRIQIVFVKEFLAWNVIVTCATNPYEQSWYRWNYQDPFFLYKRFVCEPILILVHMNLVV